MGLTLLLLSKLIKAVTWAWKNSSSLFQFEETLDQTFKYVGYSEPESVSIVSHIFDSLELSDDGTFRLPKDIEDVVEVSIRNVEAQRWVDEQVLEEEGILDDNAEVEVVKKVGLTRKYNPNDTFREGGKEKTGPCPWCVERAGVYESPSWTLLGTEPFRQHKRCRCTLVTNTGSVPYGWKR